MNFDSRFEGENPILGPQNFVKFYLSLIFTLLQQFMCLALKVKKFEFLRACLEGIPFMEPPVFVWFSLSLLSTHSENLIHLVEAV